MKKTTRHNILFLSLFTFILASVHTSMPISAAPQSINPILINPTQNIQSLIDNASPYQTLILQSGTYTQSFKITKPLTITGTDPQSTKIKACTLKNQPAIRIQAKHVTIKNISISNTAPGLYTTGIRITASNTHVDHCIIHHTPVGIAIWTSNNTISNTRFHHCEDEGIVLLNTSFAPCENNTISSCIFTDNCDAIELQRSSDNLIKNCIMKNNTHSGIDAIIDQNNNNIILNCQITKNQVHGIYFAYSSNNILSNCTIQQNTHGNIIQNPPSNHATYTILNSTLFHILPPYQSISEQNSNQDQSIPTNLLSFVQQKIEDLKLSVIILFQRYINTL